MPFTVAGYIPEAPTQSLQNAQQLFTTVFGPNVDLNPSGVVGLFAQQLANYRINNETFQAYIVNNVLNPDFASGIFLDIISKFNGIKRIGATFSVASLTIRGLAGVTIPIGSQVLNANNDVFANITAITIPSSGTINVTFQAIKSGPINVDANTINRIATPIAGWDSASNTTTGTMGVNIQSDTVLRNLRQKTLALNSANTFNSIISACSQSSTIINFGLLENYVSAPITVQGVNLVPNSIYLSVYGGSPAEVAAILYTKKSGGCAMNGNTTYTYTDPLYSYITFNAVYQSAIPTRIYVNLSFYGNTSLPINIASIIQNAFVANFNGTDGVNIPTKIGLAIFASRFNVTLASLSINQIQTLTIGTDQNPQNQGNVVSLTFDKVATLQASDVTVTVLT